MSEEELQTWTPENYIEKRVKQYQSWYDDKAVKTKALYLRMRAASVVGGALVPVLVNVQNDWAPFNIDIIRLVVTIISLIVVIIVSLESVFHYREQWKNYRSTEQLLGHETVFFLSRVGKYEKLENEKAFRLFVQRVEEAIASENSATLNIMTMASETSEAGKKRAGE
jgi:hypothetical protein